MMNAHMNHRHLLAFAKTYELGTLLAAARTIHITQPAVTQGIMRLEAQLNHRLFDRQSDGMCPTQAAELLYPRVTKALEFIGSNRVTRTQMLAFLSLARHGSYAEASTATGLARPSLHRAVTDLEQALGIDLVRRRGRGVELTALGQSTARRFNLAQSELNAGLDDLRALALEGSGCVVIGAMPLCRARVLPNAIVEFREKYSEVEISIAEGSHIELIEPLRNGELDFLIGALRDPPPGADLVQEPLFDDCPVILGRFDHPLAKYQQNAPAAALTRYEWCIPQKGIPLRDRWEAHFMSEGLMPPRVSVECGSGIAIRQILMKTDFLTLLSLDQVAVELEAGWLTVIGRMPQTLTRTIGLTYREGWLPTRTQKAFIETLRGVCDAPSSFV